MDAHIPHNRKIELNFYEATAKRLDLGYQKLLNVITN